MINLKKIIVLIILIFLLIPDLSAQWAIDNFEKYLVNGKIEEYITCSKNELSQSNSDDRRNILLTISLYEMLSGKLNNQIDLDDLYYVVGLLDLETTRTRYDFDDEFVIAQIIVNERRYYLLLNESEEYLLNIELEAITENGYTYKTIKCGAWNYCAKLFDKSDNVVFYKIISYNQSNRGLSYRPCVLRKW